MSARWNGHNALRGRRGQSQSDKFMPPGNIPGGNLTGRPNIGRRVGLLESRDVGTVVDHQRKVLMGGLSDEGCKIAAREINRRVIVEVAPLRWETREMIN